MSKKEDKLSWDDYFKSKKRPVFQKLASLYRWLFISKSVKYYSDKYFPESGIFIETGSGTSQSSSRIRKAERKLIALDYNNYVLSKHNILEYKVRGDILSLPFKSKVADGVWNIGVLEHFNDFEAIFVLKECKRVLKDEGVLLIYWPPYFAPYNIVLNLICSLFKILFGKEIEFFPNEINPYRNRRKLVTMLNGAGLRLIKLDYNFMDLFTYMVIIAGISK